MEARKRTRVILIADDAGAYQMLVRALAHEPLIEVITSDGESPAVTSNWGPGDSEAVVRIQALAPASDGLPACLLTSAELRVMRLAQSGASYKEIAAMLGSAPGTIHSHLKRAYKKLGARGRKAAVARAQELKILPAGGN